METLPTRELTVPAAVGEPSNVSRTDVSLRSIQSSSSSRGVACMEVIAEVLTKRDRWRIFVSLLVFAFAYSVNHSINGGPYSMFVTEGDLRESLVVSPVVWSITAAVTYFVFAKIADVFGRLELIIVSLVFDAAGTAVMNAGKSASTFHLGKVLHQIGYATMLLLSEVIVADLTSLRTRLFFSSLPLWPTLPVPWLNTYIMANASLMGSGLRWFLIMWSLIVPVSAIPLLLSLWLPLRRANREERAMRAACASRKQDVRRLATKLFWEIDVIGLALLIAVFTSVLVPFTIAGESLHMSEEWSTARILVPVLVGTVCCLPLWIVWEQKTKTPLISATLLSDRIIWAALGTSCMLTFCWSVQAKFVTNVLMIVFGDSVESVANDNIDSLYSVSSVIVSTLVGCAVLRVRQLKPFITMGSVLMIGVFGMLVSIHSGDHHGRIGMILAQILLGISWGLILEPTKALIQAATQHDDVAAVTGLYMATSSIGVALGSAVSGAIWKQTIVPALIRALPAPGNTMDMAVDIYENPIVYLVLHPEGSPIRKAMTQAYGHGQKLVVTTGLCLCLPLIATTCCLRNPKMGDERFVAIEDDNKEFMDDVSRPQRWWTWFWT